jgi:5-(aminomethyl)-3-furanmethanol phosphate kinase
MSLRVIKLGGSLLTLPDWHERFLRWLATEPPATNLLMIGGGELVDCLRREHERFPYPEGQMHFAALAAMDINAQLAIARLPQAQWLQPELHTHQLPEPPSIMLVRITAWWNATFVKGNAGPEESWRLTSDSLAALLAVKLQAAELVLLKSAEPPPDQAGCSRATTWAEHGYVDPLFAESLAEFVNIRAMNLRASESV